MWREAICGKQVGKQALTAAGLIAWLSQRLDNLTTRIEAVEISVQSPRLERRMRGLARTGRQLISAVLFAALLIGGILPRAEDIVCQTVLRATTALPLLHAVFVMGLGDLISIIPVAALDTVTTKYEHHGKRVVIIGLSDVSSTFHGRLAGNLEAGH